MPIKIKSKRLSLHYLTPLEKLKSEFNPYFSHENEVMTERQHEREVKDTFDSGINLDGFSSQKAISLPKVAMRYLNDWMPLPR